MTRGDMDGSAICSVSRASAARGADVMSRNRVDARAMLPVSGSHGGSLLHLFLQLSHLLAQPLDLFLGHHLRAGLQILNDVLEAVNQSFYLGTLGSNGREQLCVGLLRVGKSRVHFGGLRLEKRHEMRQVDFGGWKRVRAAQLWSVSAQWQRLPQLADRDLRHRYLDGPAVGFGTLLPQSRILNGPIQ
jgi:hypothetical protein